MKPTNIPVAPIPKMILVNPERIHAPDRDLAMKSARLLLANIQANGSTWWIDQGVDRPSDYQLGWALTLLTERVIKYRSEHVVAAENVVRTAIVALKLVGTTEPDWSGLSAALQSAISDNSRRQLLPFRVAVPVYAQGAIRSKRKVRVCRLHLAIHPPGWFRSEHGKALLKKTEGMRFTLNFDRWDCDETVVLTADVRAPSSDSAYRFVEEEVAILQAICNFAAQGWHWPVFRSGVLKEGRLLNFPVSGVFSDSQLDRWYFSMPMPYVSAPALSDEQWTATLRWLRKLRSPSIHKHLRSKLITALRNYGAAMENPDRSSAYLSLWQVLEAITCSEPGTKMDLVIGRAARLMHGDELVRHQLGHLAGIRNRNVHLGQMPNRSLSHADDVDRLRVLVSLSLRNVILLAPKLHTLRNLQNFYDLPSSAADLRGLRAVLDIAEEFCS